MAFVVKYYGDARPDETVDADGYRLDGDWFEFVKIEVAEASVSERQVLRVRANDVSRIEETADSKR